MRYRIYALLVFSIGLTGSSLAQRVELEAFGSYGSFDVSPFPNNAVGLGGRLDVNLTRHIALEGEGSWDFKHPRVTIAATGTGTFEVSSLRLGVAHGNGGLKFQSKGGSYFLFAKGGALVLEPDVRTTPLLGAVIGNEQRSETSFSEAVFYPGGGIGFHAGPLGIRVDIGDEIFWDNGAHNNPRVTFGPTVRF